jgi:glutamine amidotransferase/cyclase
VASRYFRAGADKVSIGSDAVYAAEEYYAKGGAKTGETSIESISSVYGVQAVVISIDPKRVYVSSPAEVADSKHVVVELGRDDKKGPSGGATGLANAHQACGCWQNHGLHRHIFLLSKKMG